jgi:hypothetical protein
MPVLIAEEILCNNNEFWITIKPKCQQFRNNYVSFDE